MKEIKFRAWNKRGVYENTMVYQDGPDLDGVIYYTATVGSQEIYYNFEDIMDKKYFILMQYTGLEDKNGKEIYEGDIVKCPDLGVMTVEWCEQEAGWRLYKRFVYKDREYEGWMWADIEIIGNVYENPELLK